MSDKELSPRLRLSKHILFLLFVILLTACQENELYYPGEGAMKATLAAPYTTACTVSDARIPESQDYLHNPIDTYIDYADVCALQEIGVTPEILSYIRERTYQITFKNHEGVNNNGTAWLVQQTEKGAVLATNKHADIPENSSVTVYRPGIDGMPVQVKLMQRNTHPEADLATLLVTHSSNLPPDLSPIPMGTQNINQGDPMMSIGFPSAMINEGSTSIQVIYALDSNNGDFIASGLSGRGSSGSPVIALIKSGEVSKDGTPQVVGVVWGSITLKDIPLFPSNHNPNKPRGKVVHMEPSKFVPSILMTP